MDKMLIRNRLMENFQKMEKSALAATVRRFTEGELAVLHFIGKKKTGVNPSQISDHMTLSRSRVASILSVLRKKDFVSMEIAADDRRKMTVSITLAGRNFLDARYDELLLCFDRFIEAVGEEDALSLAELTDRILSATENAKDA